MEKGKKLRRLTDKEVAELVTDAFRKAPITDKEQQEIEQLDREPVVSDEEADDAFEAFMERLENERSDKQ